MTGFRVKVNSTELVSVSNENLNMLTIYVHGDVLSEQLAEIEMHGEYYGGEASNTHFIWLTGHQLRIDDTVEIEFVKSAQTSKRGKTIEELYPENNEPEKEQTLEELYSSLAQLPKVRSGYQIEIEHSSGSAKMFEVNKHEYSFGFIVMWERRKPNFARVSLTSNTLEGVAKQNSGVNHARTNLNFGESVKIDIKPNNENSHG